MPLTDEQVTDLLRQNQTFANASHESLTALVAGFSARPVKAGEKLVCQDDRGEEMFLIVDGSCDVFVRKGKSATAQKVGTLGKGEIFGEIAALTGGKRLASVHAAEDSLLLAIGHDALHRALHKAPHLTEAICLSLVKYMDS